MNRQRKRKTNQAVYSPQGMDACYTPGYALEPLLPYLEGQVIWESAAGGRTLSTALCDSGFQVVESDLAWAPEYDVFNYDPGNWTVQLTNPPFSIKYKFLARAYELGKPFALLVPVETIGAKSAQVLMKQYGFELMLLNHRVNFIMPYKGAQGTAHFPVLWFCWKLLPERVMFGDIYPD